MWAASVGHVGVVKALLDKGAEVNKKGSEGRTALMFAVKRWGHALKKDSEMEEIVRMLHLEKDADLEARCNPHSDNSGKQVNRQSAWDFANKELRTRCPWLCPKNDETLMKQK